MQRNKYLDDLNITIEKYGTNFVPDNDSRYKTWNEEKSLYGFDARETWNLDELMIEWLYSHLMMYKERARIDMTYHKFDIPVLQTVPENKKDMYEKYYIERIENHTQGEAIDLCIEYLKYYLIIFNYVYVSDNEISDKCIEKARCALKILAEIFPALWW